MKLLKKLSTKKHNKAFSLVEVLCAICLLALVATPVLQCIFSSLKLNMKSREVLGGSDLTSAIMENISSKAFYDYTYGSPATTIPGFKTYFNQISSTGYLAPGITGTYQSSWDSAPYHEVKVSNIEYEGYTYVVEVIYNDYGYAPNDPTHKYYSVFVEVKTTCIPKDGSREIECCDTTTFIANKY